MLRILHTSDWHLGHNLFHRDRKREHTLFLDWLLNCLTQNAVTTLIIAGDIFDTVAPPNYALTFYYDFLKRLSQTPCRQTIIIGGNHDSAATLHAPRELLKAFDIHVIGSINKNCPADDLVVLTDTNNQPAAIVCAVPFLREKDIRSAVPGQSFEEKNRAHCQGVADHYAHIHEEALALMNKIRPDGGRLPLIGTGHFFTAGSELSEGVREATVGSLGAIPTSVFPDDFVYVALGHLHKAQHVRGTHSIKYSGSPLPLSFGETDAAKEVTLITLNTPDTPPAVESIPVPRFQKIKRLKGTWQALETFFSELPPDDDEMWLDVHLDTDHWGAEVQDRLAAMAKDKSIDILSVRNCKRQSPLLLEENNAAILSDLAPQDVFSQLLALSPPHSSLEEAEINQAFHELLITAEQKLEGDRDAD